MAALLFGLETKYAIAGLSPSGDVCRDKIVQHLVAGARRRLVHLPDLQSTGGVFLGNGSRFYVDCGLHPEICTPECSDPWDAVRYIQAGHRTLFDLVSLVGSANWPGAAIMSFRCNVDYGGSHSTWGCHESYMHRIFQEALQPQIVPHLVTRQIYTGAGGFNPFSAGLEFTLSPRMTHFRRLVTESSTTGRGIWHEKSESLCAGFERLHVLCGESLCSETATFLKVGVTALIVAMADAGLAPGSAVQLADPLRALHSVAGDVTCRKPLKMADGSSKTAIEIQRHYLEQAEAHAGTGAMPAWAADVCRRWRAVLDQLEEGPVAVKKTLDWGSSPDWLYQIPHPGQHTAGVPASICWRHRPQNTGRSAPGKSTAAASVSVEKY
jgi:proteasome accessory factor A